MSHARPDRREVSTQLCSLFSGLLEEDHREGVCVWGGGGLQVVRASRDSRLTHPGRESSFYITFGKLVGEIGGGYFSVGMFFLILYLRG